MYINTVIQKIFGSEKISVSLENSFSVNSATYTEHCIRTVVLDVAGNFGRSGTLVSPACIES